MMEDGLILETDIIEAELTKKITKRVTDEVTKRVTDEVTKQVTDEVTKQVTDEVTKQVTKQSQTHFILKAYEKLHDIEQVASFLDLSPDLVRTTVQES